jgi:polar amino acid transport system substrate-binding protein
MKKIITLALAIVMILGCVMSFASCSKQELNFGKSFSALDGQMDVLIGLNAKTIDVGVMDSVMAGYYMSQDSTYSDSLMVVEGLTLATEKYGIAARKGSGLAKKINAALIELAKDGTVDEIAEEYGLKSEICIDKNANVADLTADEQADWDYLVGQGKFIVGYTLFAPIAFEDNDGNLVGFDIELAKAVAEVIDLDVEFKLINWATKEAELESKTIDCIWNGMTITPEREAAMEITIPYMNNKQVAVIRKADKEVYKSTDDMAKAIVGAEDGSAGMSCVVKEEEE